MTYSELNNLSDYEIVAAILRRDKLVTEYFFFRKCYPLFKACFDRYYTDCESCTEFINEIYLYLMIPSRTEKQSYMQTFSFRCSLTNWLKIVAETYCHQLFRKKGSIIKESLDDSDRFYDVPDSLSSEQSAFAKEDLQQMLLMMPNMRYREIIRLKYIENCSNEEVAMQLGMSIDNFYNKHLLAKKQFIIVLKKEGLL